MTRAGPDWQAIRDRLASADDALAGGWRMSDEARARTLEARRQQLARRPEQPRVQERPLELATFSWAAARYGIEARFVREFTRLEAWTRFPGGPPFLAGVTHLRGDILPLVTLSALLGRADPGTREGGRRALILGLEAPEIGLLVDREDVVLRVDAADLRRPPRARGRDCVRGVLRDSLTVLDGERLLDESLFGQEST
jgi:purine-binding chemotaxis protein CheW